MGATVNFLRSLVVPGISNTFAFLCIADVGEDNATQDVLKSGYTAFLNIVVPKLFKIVINEQMQQMSAMIISSFWVFLIWGGP